MGALGRAVRARAAVAARPSRAEGARARGAGRLRRGDRRRCWRTRCATSASTSGFAATFPATLALIGTQRIDGRAGRRARRSRRLPALQGDRGDREAPARSPGDLPVRDPRSRQVVVTGDVALLQRPDAAAQPAASRARRRRLAARAGARGQAAPHDRSDLPAARPALSRRGRRGGALHDRAGRIAAGARRPSSTSTTCSAAWCASA